MLLVTITSTFNPKQLLITLYPLLTRLSRITLLISSITSNILSLGISAETLTGTTGASGKVVRTVEEIVRIKHVISFIANFSPLLHLFPVTTHTSLTFSIFKEQLFEQTIKVNSFIIILFS